MMCFFFFPAVVTDYFGAINGKYLSFSSVGLTAAEVVFTVPYDGESDLMTSQLDAHALFKSSF